MCVCVCVCADIPYALTSKSIAHWAIREPLLKQERRLSIQEEMRSPWSLEQPGVFEQICSLVFVEVLLDFPTKHQVWQEWYSRATKAIPKEGPNLTVEPRAGIATQMCEPHSRYK